MYFNHVLKHLSENVCPMPRLSSNNLLLANWIRLNFLTSPARRIKNNRRRIASSWRARERRAGEANKLWNFQRNGKKVNRVDGLFNFSARICRDLLSICERLGIIERKATESVCACERARAPRQPVPDYGAATFCQDVKNETWVYVRTHGLLCSR